MLEVKHLRRVYKVKNGSPVYALDDVSLKFPETGLVFILGKSGSGKSTLLNVMGGLDKIDDGEIIINGKSSKDFSGGEMDSYRNTYLGFIFQEYNILNDFTVKENIGLALQLQHKKATDEEIEKILAEVDLTGYGKRKPNELSGGQKQRVAIARALVKEPKIIFGDEPTGALDSNTGKQVFETLKKLSKDKLVVIVSHDRDFAEHFGDRVIELKDGKVISDITKKSVQAKQEQPGLTILGDNVIRIEKGHALTMDDLVVINKALANQENDTFITADAHVNDAICEAARIDKSGNRQEFFSTVNDDIKTGNEKFSVIKSKFSLGNAFKMGSRSLKVKPFRLVMTILLSSMSFTLFGASLTIGLFSSAGAMTDATLASHTTNTIFHTNYQQGDYVESYLPEDTRSELEKQGGKVLDLKSCHIRLSYNVPEDPSIQYYSYNNNQYYTSNFEYYIETGSSFLQDSGLTMAAGRLPENRNEIALPLHAAETFQDFGFRDCVDSSYSLQANDSANPITLDKLIGHYVKGHDYNKGTEMLYQITGFVDTKFDPSFSEYRRINNAVPWTDEKYSKLYNIQNSSIHGCVFMSQEDGQENKDVICNNYITYRTSNGDNYSCTMGYFPSHKNLIFFEEGKTSLQGNEILVTPNAYFDLLRGGKYDYEPITGTFKCEGAYEDLDEQTPMSITFTDRYNAKTSLRYVSVCQVARNKYEEFKDTEIFKTYFENKQPEIYGYYGNEGCFRDSENPDNFYYPWEHDSTYVLTHDDRLNLFSCMKEYLKQIYDNYLTTAPYYSDLKNETDYWTTEFEKAYPLDAQEKAMVYSDTYNDIRQDFVMKNALSIYEAYKNNLNYLAIYNSYVDTNETQKKMNVLYSIIDQGSIQEIVDLFTSSLISEMKPLLIDRLSLQPMTQDLYYNGKTEEVRMRVKIVGLDFDFPYYYDKYFHASETIINQIQKDSSNYNSRNESYLLLLPQDRDPLFKTFQYIEEKNKEFESYDYNKAPVGSISFRLSDDNISRVQSLSNMLAILTKVFVYVGLGLAIFSMFLFYNFISISINNKKREIGILRAVGAKRFDVFKIFYSESFIIAMINFVLASIATFVLTILLNGVFQEQAKVTFDIMSPNVFVYAVIALIAVVTSLISALLPVTRLANKRPIDAIQNR